MADNEEKRGYPRLPSKNWWDIRRAVKRSPASKVDSDYLMSVLNLTSTGSAMNIVAVLRRIGLIDDSGNLTPLAHDWRDDESYSKACKDILAEVYPSSLTDAFPPPKPDRAGVQRWFARNAKVGEAASGGMTTFYLLLCEADPASESRQPERTQTTRVAAKPKNAAKKSTVRSNNGSHNTGGASPPPPPSPPGALSFAGVGGITINIELQLPATADAKFFDQFFASMRKHLIEQE